MTARSGDEMTGNPGGAHRGTAPPWSVLAVPLLGLGLAACGAVLLSRGAGPGLAHDAGTALGLGAAAAGCLLVLAWAVAALLAVLAVLAHRHRWERLGRLCRRLSPALLRRAAAAVLGVQLLTAPRPQPTRRRPRSGAGPAATPSPAPRHPRAPGDPRPPRLRSLPRTPPYRARPHPGTSLRTAPRRPAADGPCPRRSAPSTGRDRRARGHPVVPGGGAPGPGRHRCTDRPGVARLVRAQPGRPAGRTRPAAARPASPRARIRAALTVPDLPDPTLPDHRRPP